MCATLWSVVELDKGGAVEGLSLKFAFYVEAVDAMDGVDDARGGGGSSSVFFRPRPLPWFEKDQGVPHVRSSDPDASGKDWEQAFVVCVVMSDENVVANHGRVVQQSDVDTATHHLVVLGLVVLEEQV